MRPPCHVENLQRPHQKYKKTGHPRTSWVEDNLARTHMTLNPLTYFDPKNQEHINELIEGATARVFQLSFCKL